MVETDWYLIVRVLAMFIAYAILLKCTTKKKKKK